MSFINKPFGWCSYTGIMGAVFDIGVLIGLLLMVYVLGQSIYGLVFCYLIMLLALTCGIYLAELARRNDGKVKLLGLTIQFDDIGITKIYRQHTQYKKFENHL
jgi:hypothetical protein